MRFPRSRCASLLGSTVVVVAVAAFAPGCDSVEGQAFDVEGRSTSQRDFDRELEALAENDQFVELYEQGGEPVSATDGTVSASLTAQWATLVIQQEIVAAAAEREGIEIGDEDRAAAEIAAADLFGGEQLGGLETFEAFPEWFRDRLLERLALQSAYLESTGTGPSEDEVRAFYDENLPALVQSCPSGKFVSHILVESREQADAIVQQLAAGASFEELAQAQSTDPSGSRGGFLDCFQEGQYAAEFEAAVAATAAGQTTGPIQTEFGWHVIKVAAEPAFEALREQIESSLGDTGRREAMQRLLEEADVDVNPRYGTWVVDDQQIGVVPPEPKVPESTEPPPPSLGTDQPGVPPGAPPPAPAPSPSSPPPSP